MHFVTVRIAKRTSPIQINDKTYHFQNDIEADKFSINIKALTPYENQTISVIESGGFKTQSAASALAELTEMIYIVHESY